MLASQPLRIVLVPPNAASHPLAVLATGTRSIRVRAETPAECRVRLLNVATDLVVIDRRATGALHLVREIRSAFPGLPVLFFGGSTDDALAAMYAGANDFVLGGVSSPELLLRIQLLSSSVVRPLQRTRQIGTLRLERDARTLATATRSVSLSPIELKVFERLLLEPGRPVSRAELEQSVWGQEELEDHPTNIAVVYVSYLRRKLSQLGDACTIRTITHVGYALEVKPVSDKTPRVPKRRVNR